MALRRRRGRRREMGGRIRPYEFLWQNTVVFSLPIPLISVGPLTFRLWYVKEH
jgi:hypothetical protein